MNLCLRILKKHGLTDSNVYLKYCETIYNKKKMNGTNQIQNQAVHLKKN